MPAAHRQSRAAPNSIRPTRVRPDGRQAAGGLSSWAPSGRPSSRPTRDAGANLSAPVSAFAARRPISGPPERVVGADNCVPAGWSVSASSKVVVKGIYCKPIDWLAEFSPQSCSCQVLQAKSGHWWRFTTSSGQLRVASKEGQCLGRKMATTLLRCFSWLARAAPQRLCAAA